MLVSKFDVQPCLQLTSTIRKLIQSRTLKQMYQSSSLPPIPSIPVPPSSLSPSPPPPPIAITLQSPSPSLPLRKRIFKRHSNPTYLLPLQHRLAKRYNTFLLSYLDKTSHLQFLRNTPIQFSVLNPRNQPDYPFNYSIQSMKKDYPHYSNIISPTSLPIQSPSPVLLLPTKITGGFTDIYQNICVTVSQVKKFCKNYMQMDEEERDFERMSERLGMTVRNVKLLFEIMDGAVGLEELLEKERVGRGRNKEGRRERMVKRLKVLIGEATGVKKGKGKERRKESRFIPKGQIRLSLRQLHEGLREIEIDVY